MMTTLTVGVNCPAILLTCAELRVCAADVSRPPPADILPNLFQVIDPRADVLVCRDRCRLERLCRYALRPPLAQDRLHLTGEGEIWLTLRHRWADGTTHLRFDPLELLERLAVLTPRPRVNLILYYGVLPPRAAWRAALVPATSPGVETSHVEPAVEADEDASGANPSRAGAYQWAELMRRTFGLDVLACPRCGGRCASWR